MADIIDRTFVLLQDIFRQTSISYAVIGGFAGNVWGVDRATLDIDLLVGGRQSQFDRLITLGTEQGLQPQPQFLEMNPLLRGLMVRCRIENLHVDLLRPRDAHDRNVLRRRRQETFSGHVLWFPAPDVAEKKLHLAPRYRKPWNLDLHFAHLSKSGDKQGLPVVSTKAHIGDMFAATQNSAQVFA